MSERTLVTGFKAFKNIQDNPSATLAETSGRPFQTLEVAYRAVDDFLEGLNPDSFDRLLLMGVASGRDHLTPELFARNFIGTTPDVRGFAPEGLIDPVGVVLLQSTLWTPEISADMVIKAHHTRISYDAGNYLCNYIYYRSLERYPTKRVGFLHVPVPARLALEIQQDSLTKILEIIETE